jgi:gliding motility-associated-like protein
VTTTFTPSALDKQVTFGYQEKETVVAEFEFVPPPPPPPPLPILSGLDRSVFIPNAFSPNSDNNNDLFSIRLGKDAIGMDMTIFDRWGKQIYSSTSINAGWDGRVKGRDSDIGVYQYIIKVKFRDNKVETFTGDFTLIR